jgi:hypothetical protein
VSDIVDVTSIVALTLVVGTYFLLNAENYHWHWTAFSSAASIAGYVYLYSIYYFAFKTKMTGFFQVGPSKRCMPRHDGGRGESRCRLIHTEASVSLPAMTFATVRVGKWRLLFYIEAVLMFSADALSNLCMLRHLTHSDPRVLSSLI